MTHRAWAPVLAIVLLSPVTAHATAVSPPGVNIRWDQCYADGGAMNKTFACDTNTGSERLVLSFELASSMSGVTGLEITVQVASATTTLPAWWSFKNAGTCRQTSLSALPLPTAGDLGCADWSSGQGAGGLASYDMGFVAPNSARIRAGVAVPAPKTLDAGQEYFAAALNLNHAKSVGTGACAGCDIPVCILFTSLNIVPGFAPGVLLLNGANYQGSQIAIWQDGLMTNLRLGSKSRLGLLDPARFDCIPYDVTGSRGSTWGQVKALYR